jgi:putative membrane-bound dehydrogenase-like protein
MQPVRPSSKLEAHRPGFEQGAGVLPTVFRSPCRWMAATHWVTTAVASALAAAAPGTGDLRAPAGLRVVSVATPPTVVQPVAFDWSVEGPLWVAERVPHPATASISGRVVQLEDTEDDGVFERRTVFLDGLPPVTSLLDWPPGVLIAAAPDLWYAEDADGDGAADGVRRLFVGFGAGSAERRFNSLTLGLDGWVYAANGLAGGRIQRLDAAAFDPTQGQELVSVEEVDFRFSVGAGRFEPAAGFSWMGRTRSELGAWLGVDGDVRLVQFPLPIHYALRNPAVDYPDPVVAVMDSHGRPVDLDQGPSADEGDPGASADLLGGVDFLRVDALGPAQRGNLLVAMPWLRQILRVPLHRQDLGFAVSGEPECFLGADLREQVTRFTPTQVRTGPDGAVWVADPQIPAAASISGAGRILRIEPENQRSPRLADQLARVRIDPVQALASPNAALRDLAQRWIVVGQAAVDEPRLRTLVLTPATPTAGEPDPLSKAGIRVQALSVLRQLGHLRLSDVEALLKDSDPALRAEAIRLCEGYLREDIWPTPLAQLGDDADAEVRFQTALSLGESRRPEAARLWVQMAISSRQDPWMRAALLSAAGSQPLSVLAQWLKADPSAAVGERDERLTADLVRTARAQHPPEAIAAVLAASDSPIALAGVAELLQSASRAALGDREDGDWLLVLAPRIADARAAIEAQAVSAPALPLHLSVLGAEPARWAQDRQILVPQARHGATAPIRETALRTLLRSIDPTVAELLLADWAGWRPSLRPAILGALTTRSAWVAPTLEALEGGGLTASELSPAQQGRLLHHPDPRIRADAARLLAPRVPPLRETVVEQYRRALTRPGDAVGGRETFDARCSACHAPASPVLPIGPNLQTIGSRTPTELAIAILDPNALVEPDYRAFFVDTRDGESVTGILRRETDDALELLLVGGTLLDLPLDQVVEIRASNLSLMPEGLEAGLSPEGFSDLLAYLGTFR